MQDIPETGRECSPYKMIQANIYEAICEGLHEYCNMQDQLPEKEEEDE